MFKRVMVVLLGCATACSSTTTGTVGGDGPLSPPPAEAGVDTVGRSDVSPHDSEPGDAMLPDVSVAETGPFPDQGPVDPCVVIASRYQAALKQALACNPVLPMPQCNTKVDDDLDCPCPIYVDQGNTQAIEDLARWKKDWQAESCGGGGCPPVPCDKAAAGNCQPQGSTGDGACEK